MTRPEGSASRVPAAWPMRALSALGPTPVPSTWSNVRVARRLTPAAPSAVATALDAHRTGEATPAELRLLVKHFLAVLQERAPGSSVEVRVPPHAAAQVVPGVRHTRGTPPAVVELDAATFIRLATGELAWTEAEASPALRASGERADLTPYLPLT